MEEGQGIKLLMMPKKNAQNLKDKCDYLSELPKPLLHHILSYLTMEDVIRTSVLSKGWRYTWLSVPCLNFSSMKGRRYDGVVDFITQSLLHHKGPKIQKLNITFNYNNADAHQVDSWIHFALRRNANELYIDFNKYSRYPSLHNYKFPDFFCGYKSLTLLALKSCVINYLINFKFGSLKTLSLEQVDFSCVAINDLISACPILECLSLTNCATRYNLVLFIVDANVKTLKIHESYGCSWSSSLEICAPYIVSFDFVTSMSRKKYVLGRMQSLESASFGCSHVHPQCGQYVEDKRYGIVKILDDVHHVKNLRLCSCYIQALRIREEQSLDFLPFDATYLGIKTGLTKLELPQIIYMLRHSPNIETLIISIDKIEGKQLSDNIEDGECWKLQEPHFNHQLCNLKTVKIYNFENNLNALQSKKAINFLRFLLKNSKMLERLTITTSKKVKSGKSESTKLKLLFQLTQKLLAYPRASQYAEITFS